MGGPVRPSGYVGWGSTGMTNSAEPLDSKKGLGWGVSEKPASSYFNWIQQKQDQWIQYLDWKSQLGVVISDDFTYEDGGYLNAGGVTQFAGATLHPKWQFVEGGGAYVGIANPLDSTIPLNHPVAGAALGVAIVSAQTSAGAAIGQGRMCSRVGNLSGRDFRMEGVLIHLYPGATSSSFEFGFFNPSGVATGINMMMGFEWTGPSGIIGAGWTPSGATGMTSVALGIVPTGWQKLTIESRGPTMAFYVQDTMAAAVPAVMFGASGVIPNFGARALSTTGQTGTTVWIDRVELSVRRNPT